MECADALKAALQSEKLDCSSRDGLILWTARFIFIKSTAKFGYSNKLNIFRIHNRVNKILGKSEFPEDIEAIKKRWKVGWRDAAPQRLVDSNTYGRFYKSYEIFVLPDNIRLYSDERISAYKTLTVTNIKF